MPYPRNLQQYCQPGFWRDAPEAWVRRLSEISPDMPNLDRLVFRFFDPHESWPDPTARERGMWTLYTAKPIRLVDKDRAAQFALHWSELHEVEQAGRRSMVSDYQHFMWHSKGLYVRPFLILQGSWGGTPAKYTDKEHAFLKASHCLDEPFDIGMFPPCPFDERVVKQITLRDRLLQQSNSYEALSHMDTPDGIRIQEEEAEQVQRETYLSTWSVMIQPAVEFYKSFIHQKKSVGVLPDAPDGLDTTLGQWREHFLETGHVMDATPARQRQMHGTTISVT